VHANALRVKQALLDLGVQTKVLEMPNSTRSAAEAAATIGVEVGQIAKSLIFRAGEELVLVIASGTNRVSTKKLKALVGKKIRRADADLVKQVTGFPIGGVPPVGHRAPLRTFIDEDLQRYEEIWAAAGTPFAVFRSGFGELQRMTGGEVVNVREDG